LVFWNVILVIIRCSKMGCHLGCNLGSHMVLSSRVVIWGCNLGFSSGFSSGVVI
jgi:hypothetical protein